MSKVRTALLASLLLACRSTDGAVSAPRELVLAIAGMTSPASCPARVEAALESVAGVGDATVDYGARTATVVLLEPVDPGLLVAALQRQGYGARVR